MQWAVVIKDVDTGTMRIMRDEERGGPIDLSRFERHVAPCEQVGDGFSFGAHEFTRDCICRPEIQKDNSDCIVVVHEDRKPN